MKSKALLQVGDRSSVVYIQVLAKYPLHSEADLTRDLWTPHYNRDCSVVNNTGLKARTLVLFYGAVKDIGLH